MPCTVMESMMIMILITKQRACGLRIDQPHALPHTLPNASSYAKGIKKMKWECSDGSCNARKKGFENNYGWLKVDRVTLFKLTVDCIGVM